MIKFVLPFYLLIAGSIFAQDLISQMQVYDLENGADWSVQSNLQPGDAMFGDRTYTIDSIPAKYIGMQWIRTANDSKGFVGDTLVSFIINDTANVYIVYDDRLTIRSWLDGWTDTGDDIESGLYFSIYNKQFAADTKVSLGSLDQTSGVSNYIILVGNANTSSQLPDPFKFISKFDIVPGSTVESDIAILTGLKDEASISIFGGAYSINGSPFTSTPGSIQNGDELKINLQMPNNYGSVVGASVVVGSYTTIFSARTEDDPQHGWNQVDAILENIKTPVFPDRDFLVTDYGAVGDSITDCTEAIKNAIKACSDSGGGRVVIPQGIFLTAAIHLKSNVNLYVSKKATILFSDNPSDFLPVVYTSVGGIECYNYSAPIYAFEQQNIAVSGSGTINGNGSSWWDWKSISSSDFSQLNEMAEDGIAVEERIFGDGHYLRPNMIQLYRCDGILIDSVTILNGPSWHIHPVLSNNISVTNVRIIGHGPNNDGCNPESSSNVLIRNCYFDTGDDCIAIKSGRNADGRRINTPTENVIIQNCTMKDGHGGVVIGSEMTGGVRNIFAEDCFMDSPNLDRALRIKTNSIRGGIVENVYLRNITVGQVADAAIRVNYFYANESGTYDPIVRNIEVRDLTCANTNYALRLEGFNRSPITDLRLINCTISNASRPNLLTGIQNLILNNTSIEGTNYNTIIEPVNDIPVKINDDQTVPSAKDLILYPSYPNPFNSITTVSFYLSRKELVKMEIYNILGQKVRQVFDSVRNAGKHYVKLETGDLASGWYIYKISTKESIQAGRFLILK